MRVFNLCRQFGLLLIAGSLLPLSVLSGHVSAQSASSDNNFNLTTSPVYVSLPTKPGAVVTTPVKVQNNASSAVTLDVKLMKFKAYGNSGQAQLVTPDANDQSVKWVSFSQASVNAQPGVWNTVTMTIRPPKTAAFGYYYAVVFTKAGQPAKPAPNTRTVSGSSAVLVLMDVQVPGERRQLNVARFTSVHKVYEFLPATFEVSVKNEGDIYGAPSGDVYVSRNRKDNLATLPVNQAGGNVLPGATRAFSVDWDDGFPAHVVQRQNGQIVTDSKGHPKKQLSWAASKFNKFRFGKYYAHLLLVYNNGTQDVPVEAEVAFWVIPWKILLVALLLLLLILFAVYTLVRRTIRVGKRAAGRVKKTDSGQKD